MPLALVAQLLGSRAIAALIRLVRLFVVERVALVDII
jgi:hypothetical protein